ncbi:MAG: EAL domain-containing protein [Xanthobacteraceae bacterium]|jgi:diguanylate cyclase (GGDEF)-like protein/PAS domain S-box-containing protein
MLLRTIRSRLLGLVVAAVFPFFAAICVGLWSQLRDDQNQAVERALDGARLLAIQVDDHIGSLENLLTGLSRAVSTRLADAGANDALLRQVKEELPDYIGNILLFAPDGSNIGISWNSDRRFYAGDRAYFQQVVAGQRLAIGDVIRTKLTGEWVVTLASPVKDQTGRLRAVIAIGTKLDRFQEALRMQTLPVGSIVRIINEKGIVVAQSDNGQDWIGRNLSGSDDVAEMLAQKESSAITIWPDRIKRITGSAKAHRVPWVVSVGFPTNVGHAAMMTHLTLGGIFSGISLLAGIAIAWMLSGRIIGPLQQLQRDALALASGDLTHRTTVKTDDEVGNLAEAFNCMAASIERRQFELQESKNTLAAVIDASPVGIVCSDLERRIVLWNPAAEKLYGYSAAEAIGTTVQIVPPEGQVESFEMYRRARNGETIRNEEVLRQRKDGSLVHVKVAAAPMYSPEGAIRGVAWAHQDVTERKKVQAQLERLAHFDPLTGLPNRLSLQKVLGRLLAGEGSKRPISVALFDLDSFKDVNDTLGHSVGDQLLVEVGQRFIEATNARANVQVFRLGGDEFVLVVPECGDPRVISEIVDAVLNRLARNFEINEHSVRVGGSAGIAIAPNDGTTVDELLANADLALYQAKSNGGRTRRFFLPVHRAQVQARRALDLELTRAYAQKELEIYFQPEIRLIDRAVVGAEALLRWRHPERGIVMPGAFIETLATNAIALDVGRWIILTACQKAAAWRTMGLSPGRIGINVFPPQFQGDVLLKAIEDAIRETNLPPESIEIEITENSTLNYEGAAETLQKLHEKRVRIAFDDFGTGYASLSYLTRFPLSRIKIDRSFVRKIIDDTDAAAIVRSLIVMAHNLGLEVIAEGVETQAQAEFLLGEGCEEAQGFLYGEPLSAVDFEKYLRARQLTIKTAHRLRRGSRKGAPVRRMPRSSTRLY